MRKGFLYLLLSTFFLGISSAGPPVTDSPMGETFVNEETPTEPRVVGGSEALFAAVSHAPYVEKTEVAVSETEVEPVSQPAEQPEETEKAESLPEDPVETSEALETPETSEAPKTTDSTEPSQEPETDASTETTGSASTGGETQPAEPEPKEEETEIKEEKVEKKETKAADSSQKPEEEPAEDTSAPVSESTVEEEPVEEAEPEPEAELSPYEEEKRVLDQVIAQLDFNIEGHQFFLSKFDDTLYQVEIRYPNTQGDVDISNMVGIYHYDTETGNLTVMDPITGEFK